MKDLTEKNNDKGPSLYLRSLRFIEKITSKKFIIKLCVFTILVTIILFPAQIGDVIGTWYHELTNAFIEADM